MKRRSNYVFKIVVGGAGGVGKTTLLHRYLHDVFKTDTAMTIGVEFHTRELVRKGQRVSLQIWDLGGQERFRFLQPMHCAGARGAIVFFDLSRISTLAQVKDWVDMIRQQTSPSIPIILGGTKLDLTQPEILESIEENVQQLCEEEGLLCHMFTSAKDGTNVEEIILYIVDYLIDQILQSRPLDAAPVSR
ncbi:MAG TPA: Rab family GTPase [Candidatus Lokiarchaeia archaeon]|nr:Rab family GTPase [Candidatus Lokiarchaeia archaeon]